MVMIEKEKVMIEILDTLRRHMENCRGATTVDMANIYLGQLSGIEGCFYIVSVMGQTTEEYIKISDVFKKELEDARQILSKKFESGKLR